MSTIVEFFIVALTIFLIADAILWLLFRSVPPRSEREHAWDRLRQSRSWVFRYASRPIERIGQAICRLLPPLPISQHWRVNQIIVPFSPPTWAGYHFVLAFLAVLLPVLLVLPGQSFPFALLITIGLAWLWAVLKLRSAHRRFLERLLRIQIDLGFAIDMAELFHNENDHQSMSVAHAMQQVAKEFQGTELGDELAIANADFQGNVAFSDCLRFMHERMNRDDQVGRFADLISAQYEGAASKASLRHLADELNRYRRNLLLEQAENAKVKLALPTTMVTFACVFMLIAPFAVRMSELIHQFRQ